MKLQVDPERIVSVPKRNCAEADRPEWDPALRAETYKLEYASYVRFGYQRPEALAIR